MSPFPFNRVRACLGPWLERAADLVGPVEVDVAGYATRVELTAAALERVYLPVLALLAESSRSERRVLAGLAGIPGGGKSTFAAVLAHVAERLVPPQHLVIIGMDGWHYPNAILDRRTIREADGGTVCLRARKGGPESFDVASMTAALRDLQSAAGDVALPVYDRRRHDPVPAGLIVPAATRIVLVEGNYLLCDAPPWDAASALLHPKLLLECDPSLARERVIARHVRGGLTTQEAAMKYEANDRKNTDVVLASAARADAVIRFDRGEVLLADRFRPDAPVGDQG